MCQLDEGSRIRGPALRRAMSGVWISKAREREETFLGKQQGSMDFMTTWGALSEEVVAIHLD